MACNFRVVVKPKASPGNKIYWANIYADSSGYIQLGGAYPTRKKADDIAKPWRYCCVPIEVPIPKNKSKPKKKY